jgi:hypothetical protein
MPVKAIVNDVELAIYKPVEERLFGPRESRLPGFKPVQLLRHVFPKLVAVSQGPPVEVLVIIKPFGLHVSSNIGIFYDVFGWYENAIFDQNTVRVFKTKVTTHVRLFSFFVASNTRMHYM